MLCFDERDRDSVLRDLESEDQEVRRLAVERMEVLPAGEVVPALIACLGDPCWRVRKAAVSRLSAWPDGAEVASLLIEALYDGDNPGRRNAAVEALVQSGRAAIPRLVEAADVDDPDVRKFVVDALAGIGAEESNPALIERLADADANVRAAAAEALGAIGGEAALRALRDAIAAPGQPELVRFSALHALDVLEAPVHSSGLVSALEERVLRPAALLLLGRVEGDADAVEILFKALASDARSCRESAIRALLRLVSGADGAELEDLVARVRTTAQASPDVVDQAIDRLGDADLPTQLILVQFLALTNQERAAVPVLRAGGDEALEQVVLASLASMGAPAANAIDASWGELDADARRDACVLFGTVEGDISAARLLAALEDSDPLVRTVAARSVGSRGVIEAVAPLVSMLECAALDGDFDGEEERLAVTQALICLAEGGEDPVVDRVVEGLLRLLEGPERVRVAAAAVIGGVGRPRDAETVALLLRDASADVRRAAVEALARIDTGSSADALHVAVADEAPMVRVAAAAALGGSEGPDVSDDLARLARDDEPRVRAAAVRAVAHRLTVSTDADWREPGLAIVEGACADVAPVALAALDAVREIGAAAVGHTLGLLRRPEADVVREAVRCVGLHGDDTDLEEIVPLIAHADWSVRAEAIQTLASRRVQRSVPAILRRLDTEQDEYVRSVTLRALQRLDS